MTLRTSTIAAASLGFALCLGALPATGQSTSGGKTATPPTTAPKPAVPAKPAVAPKAPDAIPDTARLAWEALPIGDRKAIQDALVWAGTYNSIIDGEFGRNTYDALRAFEARNKLGTDGTVDAGERKIILDAGDAARKAAKFTLNTDTVTGAIIGIPQALVGAPVTSAKGTTWAATSKKFSIETETYGADTTGFVALFDRLKADASAGRKVTYSVIRPDWFVVSGETATRRFYTRVAKSDARGISGYTFWSDKAAGPDVDKLIIAVANSFSPFAAQSVKTVGVSPSGEITPTTPKPGTPPAVSIPAGPAVASGLMIAPGKVLTVARAVDACRTISVGRSPATVARLDPALGLALLDTNAAEARPSALTVQPAAPGVADLLVVLGYTETPGKLGPMMVTAGETVIAPAKAGRTTFRVLTPLQRGGTGAVVTDRTGALVALVTQMPREPRQVAGIVPQMAHEVVSGPDIASFVTASGLTTRESLATDIKTAGEIAALSRSSIVPVLCTR